MFRFDLWEKRKEEGEGGKREREQDWEEGRMGGRERDGRKKIPRPRLRFTQPFPSSSLTFRHDSVLRIYDASSSSIELGVHKSGLCMVLISPQNVHV